MPASIENLEGILLSSIHDKAIKEGIDLNDKEQFMKFFNHVMRLRLQSQNMIKQIVATTPCGCSKKRAQSNTRPEDLDTTVPVPVPAFATPTKRPGGFTVDQQMD